MRRNIKNLLRNQAGGSRSRIMMMKTWRLTLMRQSHTRFFVHKHWALSQTTKGATISTQYLNLSYANWSEVKFFSFHFCAYLFVYVWTLLTVLLFDCRFLLEQSVPTPVCWDAGAALVLSQQWHLFQLGTMGQKGNSKYAVEYVCNLLHLYLPVLKPHSGHDVIMAVWIYNLNLWSLVIIYGLVKPLETSKL